MRLWVPGGLRLRAAVLAPSLSPALSAACVPFRPAGLLARALVHAALRLAALAVLALALLRLLIASFALRVQLQLRTAFARALTPLRRALAGLYPRLRGGGSPHALGAALSLRLYSV